MNQQEKSYACQRVREISVKKQITCECEKADLFEHLKTAAVNMSLTLKSPAEIFQHTFEKVVDGDKYEMKFRFSDIFEEPSSYILAKNEEQVEIDKHAAENAKITAYADSIIDRIMLNKYESGEVAIAEMQAFTL